MCTCTHIPWHFFSLTYTILPKPHLFKKQNKLLCAEIAVKYQTCFSFICSFFYVVLQCQWRQKDLKQRKTSCDTHIRITDQIINHLNVLSFSHSNTEVYEQEISFCPESLINIRRLEIPPAKELANSQNIFPP